MNKELRVQKAIKDITADQLRSMVTYDQETGEMVWRIRPGLGSVNTKFAGRQVGTIGADGYRIAMVNGKNYPVHRLAFLYVTGEMPQMQIDHINHIRDDNRWQNLRLASHSENCKNMALHRDNWSGVSGVSWYPPSAKWRAQIRHANRQKHLGLFVDFFEAVCVRKSAEMAFGFHEDHGSPKAKQYRYKTLSGRSAE